MTDTINAITNTIHCSHVAILPLAKDTLVYKFYNISPPPAGSKWSDYFKLSIDLIIAIIGASVIVWQYLNQRQKELEERIIESKRMAYSEFLKDFTQSAVKIMHNKDT